MDIKSGNLFFHLILLFGQINVCRFSIEKCKISNVEIINRFCIVFPSQNFRNRSFDAWKLGMVGETGSLAA